MEGKVAVKSLTTMRNVVMTLRCTEVIFARIIRAVRKRKLLGLSSRGTTVISWAADKTTSWVSDQSLA